jgi:histidinol-phosphate/aromatic aminotransferase/cobyric acid decarboxylase-like protein
LGARRIGWCCAGGELRGGFGSAQNAFGDGYDLVAIVNPNSPTGRHIPRERLEDVLRSAPSRTRVWVDETYAEYAGAGQSLERFAAGSENVIVCKSMSKVYALSGMRVAYLCAGPHQLEELRAITPPWVVGLPAQLAATVALQDAEYYRARYEGTHGLREELAKELEDLGWEVVPGVANFLLCQLPESGPTAADVVRECRRKGLFLRDATLMGVNMGGRMLRIAVKDARTNREMVRMIRIVINAESGSGGTANGGRKPPLQVNGERATSGR